MHPLWQHEIHIQRPDKSLPRSEDEDLSLPRLRAEFL